MCVCVCVKQLGHQLLPVAFFYSNHKSSCNELIKANDIKVTPCTQGEWHLFWVTNSKRIWDWWPNWAGSASGAYTTNIQQAMQLLQSKLSINDSNCTYLSKQEDREKFTNSKTAKSVYTLRTLKMIHAALMRITFQVLCRWNSEPQPT